MERGILGTRARTIDFVADDLDPQDGHCEDTRLATCQLQSPGGA